MIYIRLKTFFCAQLMGIKYNLQSEVIHGKVSLSNWFRIYDWFHSNCFEFYDSGCILLVNTRTVLSPVGPGKMSVMVTPNQTDLSLFGEPDQASEFFFVYYTSVIHFLCSWQVQEKGSHYFSGVVSTNGRRRIWWTVDPGAICFLGGGAMVKCQESVYPCKFTYYLFRLCRLFDHSVKIIIHLMMNLKLTILVLGFAPLHGRFDVFQNMKSWQSSQQKWLIFWRLIFTKMIYFSMNNVKYYLISSADIYTCTTINLI